MLTGAGISSWAASSNTGESSYHPSRYQSAQHDHPSEHSEPSQRKHQC